MISFEIKITIITYFRPEKNEYIQFFALRYFKINVDVSII